MKKFFILIIFFKIGLTALSQDTIFVQDEVIQYWNDDSLTSSPIYHYIDTTGSLILEDVIDKDFQKEILHNQSDTFRKSNSIWYRLLVKNKSKKYRHFFIAVNSPISDNLVITLYDTSLRSDKKVMNGFSLPDSLRDVIIGARIAVTFNLDFDETKTLYLNLSELSPQNDEDYVLKQPQISFLIGSMNLKNQKEITKRSYQGIVLGFLIFMCLYHLILYFKIHKKEYFAFSFYAASATWFFIYKMGYGYEILDISNTSYLAMSLPFIFFSYMILSLFYIDLKNLANKSYKFILIGVLTFAFLLITTLLFPKLPFRGLIISEIIDYCILIIGMFCLIILLYTIVPYVKLAIKGNRSSKYFLFANLLFIGGFTFYIVMLIYDYRDEANYFLAISFAGQMIIYSLGLADKMQLTLKEKNRAQQELIEQMKFNSELQQKVNKELEQLVQERTQEIEQQKEEIIAQSEEIATQRDMLLRRNKDINDSIEYASFIQQALLTSKDVLEECNLSYFILYKPRDVISGDFYWFKKIKNYVYITAADCTGHGVPGAFMSVLGISLLNEIVGKRDLNAPAIVLNELRKKLKRYLNQEDLESKSKDGIDISLCRLDLESKCLQFAGAYNPLILIRNSQLIEYSADHMPIGIHPRDSEDFTNYEIILEPADSIYLFSDGYLSQFGGDKGRCFTRKQFKKLLLETNELEENTQKQILETKLIEWQKDFDQIDDILVLKIKV